MSNEHPSEIVGKRIFFLFPSAAIQNQIIVELVQQEYEVYVVRDHLKLQAFLRKNSDAIVFLNINDRLPEPDCESWLKTVRADSTLAKVEFGVISTSSDAALLHTYIEVLKLRGGFILMKSNMVVQSIKQILEVLKTADAKGRRKYLRATTDDDPNATVNLPLNTRFVQGQVKDISVVGISCSFSEDPQLQKNSLFNDIQIKLQTTILKAEGIVFGSRMDGANKVYVILFTQRIDPDVRTKIRLYIQQNLQVKLDKELG